MESALIARMATGDERALAQLYDRYARSVYGLALAVLGDSADAEEATADAFLQAWNSAHLYDVSRGSAGAWIMTIARTRALDRLRARKRRARVLDEASRGVREGETVSVFGAPAPESADRGIELDEVRVAVARSLADLPENQRRVLELAYFGGMTQSEIAAHLGEPLGTVKTRMRTAMIKLRDALTPYMAATS